jgi:hypothetical protein
LFAATNLGHHGWLFEADGTRVLVDPLLRDGMGSTAAVGLTVYPPRVFDFDLFPRIDAVFLTHEHEDHFDIASMHLIDRGVPVYISSRSSHSMRQILSEMGFRATPVQAGRVVRVGDLELLPLTGDQSRQAVQEEWDVLPFLVRDRDGHGNLFTHVDMAPNLSMLTRAREFVARPGLWTYTNNNTVWPFMNDWEAADDLALFRFVRFVMSYHERVAAEWELPEALLVIGGSFAFDESRAWLNRNAFRWEGRELAGVLGSLVGSPCLSPLPGERLTMHGGRLGARDRAVFVTTALESAWPARDYRGDVDWLEDFVPASGRQELAPAEVAALETELQQFADHLYARGHFRRLYSLDERDIGCEPTFAVVARLPEPQADLVFEYVPQACAFRRVDCEDPVTRYLAVYECWATDLLAHLRCEMSPSALYFARSRSFNQAPAQLAFDLNHALFEYAHPLRQPARCLARYRRTLAAIASSTAGSPAYGSLGRG